MRQRMLALLLLCAVHAAYAGTNAFGTKFLAENKGKDGVTTLPSGLQYKVIKEGDGEKHPLKETDCTCHYEGRTAQVSCDVFHTHHIHPCTPMHMCTRRNIQRTQRARSLIHLLTAAAPRILAHRVSSLAGGPPVRCQPHATTHSTPIPNPAPSTRS